jgi:hypothetical protein
MVLASQSQPIIIRLADQPVRGFGLGDVLLGALGVTGVMALGALVLGLLLAAVFIGYRKLRDRLTSDEAASQTQQLGLTPPESR